MKRVNHIADETNPLVVLNKASISVQAGKWVYSTPREDRESIEDYSQVEIALFSNGENSKRLHPSMKLFEGFGRRDELLMNYEEYEEDEYPIGWCIPVDLVVELMDYLDED